MKKAVLFILCLTAKICVFAQTNTFPSSGNVGIGTTNPNSKLSVIGDIYTSGIIGGYGSYMNVLSIPPLNDAPWFFYIDTNIPASDNAAPQIQITGYAYGATNKAIKFTLGWYHYQGNFYWSQWKSDLGYHKPSRVRLGRYVKNGNYYIRIEIANDGIYWSNYHVSATDYTDGNSYYSGWTYGQGEMPSGTTQTHVVPAQNDVRIDGNLGIGITTPTEKLEVNGKIRAKEIKVETTGWPDFVFRPDYSLLSLPATEKFIKDNGHLPDMPAAKEAEANGIELGEMNKKLLQKVEELTLQLIEVNKKVEAQAIELKKLAQK